MNPDERPIFNGTHQPPHSDEGPTDPISVPAGPKAERPDVREVIEAFKAYSKGQNRSLGDLTVRELIDEGRR